ncbi:MAG: hypothetical protein CVV27_06975 [Candidatus Melainabacteria bacterium HGW-Melainabacteria-1]|nr:MAG: hypothetical protein CVV27_06975 [Candidatus Melainabacteria bacterium HGW-Melainabacteria-1]
MSLHKGKRRLCLILTVLISGLLFWVGPVAMAEAKQQKVFQTPEIEVIFPDSGYAEQALPAQAGPGYFARYSTHLKFCKQPEQPPHMQQVRSADGWLCHFYILPPLEAQALHAEVLKRQAENWTISYQREPGIGTETHAGHPMLVWRQQSGKTRLDHFLVIGPRHNYLFVSSPYGDGERIRNVVSTLKFME